MLLYNDRFITIGYYYIFVLDKKKSNYFSTYNYQLIPLHNNNLPKQADACIKIAILNLPIPNKVFYIPNAR